MPDHDEGLARIDEMLEDYVTWEGSHDAGVWRADVAEAADDERAGSYNELRYWSDDTPTSVTGSALPMVATPEEAEQGPPRAMGSYEAARRQANLYMQALTTPRRQTQNTYALLEQAMMRRRQQDPLEAAIMSMIEGEMRRRMPDLIRITAERDLDYMRTWIIAETPDVQARWAAQVDYEAPYREHRLTLTFHSLRTPGCDWLRVNPEHDTVVYHTREANPRYFVDVLLTPVPEPSFRTRSLDTRPYSVSVSDEMLRRNSIRGMHAPYVVMDEVTEAFGQLGVSAQQAAASFARIGEALTPPPAEEEPPTPPQCIPAPTVRPGLNGQRSPYGPPPRGRRR